LTTAPLRVLERSVYGGPNLYSRRPMIRIRVDLGILDQYPSDRLPGLGEALRSLLPGLADHGCSYGEPGGFLRRLAEGTWLGHIIEHVAIELQTKAGSAVTRGKTRKVRGKPGQYDILYCYADAPSGLAAGRAAIELVDALLPSAMQGTAGLDRVAPALDGAATDIEARVSALRALVRKNGLGPSTAALVAEARRRHIPVFRLDRASLIQLGTGQRQRRIRASVTGATSLIGAELAANKQAAKEMLASIGTPVPAGELVRTAPEAERAAAKLGWPVVVKPLDGNQGRGVTTGVADDGALRDAFERAQGIAPRVIVERQLIGTDHRILVVGNAVVAVAERVAAHVTGDGRSSISRLIEAVNDDPRRGLGHEAVLIPAANIPATLDGAARFNIENAAAAAAMAAAYGIAPGTIAAGLASFRPSFEDSPGRLSLTEAHGVRIVVDYAHNRAALTALADLLASMRGERNARVIGMIGIPGDRRDCDLVDIGALSGRMFDVLMLRENVDLRGRPPGEANALMRQGALAAGLDAAAIGLYDGEYDAAAACLAAARPGDIVVLTPTDVDGIWRLVEAWAADPGPEDVRLLQAANG
jgi:hypothetical protein